MPERNRELFYRIADAIEQNPEMHDQSNWIEGYGVIPGDDSADFDVVMKHVEVDGEVYACGTTQCIAGWAAVLDGQAENYALGKLKGIQDKAACALGLTEEESEDLFIRTSGHTMAYDWPPILRAIGDGADIREAVENHYIEDNPMGYRRFGERYVTSNQ